MRSKLARLGQGRVAAIGLLLLLLGALVPEQSPLFRPVRNAIFDTYQALAPRQRLSAPVVIVAIDDASLSRHGQWPWPRTVLAQLITRIADHQPAVIGIDILMPEVDRLSPPRIPELVPNLPPDVVGQLMRAPSNESVLAAALRRTRTVIGVAGLDHDYGVARTRGSWAPIRVYGGDPVPFVRRFVVGLRSVDEIDRAATGRALLNADPEGGVVRRLPLVAAVGDMLAPGLAPELLRVAIGDASLAVHATSAGVQALAIGDVRAPTERDGTMRISYSPHDGSRFVSASDVLAGAVQDAVFSRKVVLIGLTAVGLNDDQATPIFERMPGVEIHAQAIENIFDGTSLSRPAWGSWVEGAATALAGLLVIAIVPRSTVIAAAILVGVVISFWLSGFLTYLNARVLVDSASPTLSVTAVFGLSLGISLRASRRERREIRRAFERYVHPSVVASLIAEPERLVLGGERRDLTVLFADLAGFTSVSERHAPETVATLLNRCLTVVTKAIVSHGGTVDKYIGDCVMAFWGAPVPDPEHAVHACAAAIEIQDTVEKLRDELTREGLPELHIRVGINSGPAVVGNMGSETLFDYTAIGDAVNLASRLESINKLYATRIVLSEATAREIGGRFPLYCIDRVRVKGKVEPVDVYTVDVLTEGVSTRLGHAVQRFRERAWDEAEALWRGLAAVSGLETLSALYLERIVALRRTPPALDWDGAITLDTK